MTTESIFNRRPIISLLFITVLLSFLIIFILEVILRFTPYKIFVATDQGAFPPMFVVDTDAGFDLADNYKDGTHTTIESEYPVHTNNIGCFDDDVTLNTSHNILIGDSFTWGFSPLDKKWTTIVEKNTKQKLVKCGVPAYGPKQSLFKLKKIIKKIGKAPKTIIFTYYWNDLNDDHTGLPSTVFDGILVNRLKSFNYANGKVEYLSDNELLSAYQQYKKHGNSDYLDLSTYKKLKYWIKTNSIISNIVYNYVNRNAQVKVEPIVYGNTAQYQNYLARMSPDKYPWLKEAWNKHLSKIDEMIDYAKSIDSKFMIMLLPSKDHVYQNNINEETLSNIEKSRLRLKNHFEYKNVQYFDLFDDFSMAAKQTNNLYLSNDLHFSHEGETLAGKVISDYLLKSNYFELSDKEK